MKIRACMVVVLAILVAGCANAARHRAAVLDDRGERLTLGTVQKEIKIGMSSAAVAEVLGSPNMVTTDENRCEVWVYDKIATDVTYSRGSGYATIILAGIEKDAGASSTSQRTMTIVVKFDAEGKVRDFAYHASRF